MIDLRKAAEMALEALEFAASEIYNEHNDDVIADAIKALRQALAQPEQEPVAWVDKIWVERPDLAKEFDMSRLFSRCKLQDEQIPLYTAPPSKPEQEPFGYVIGMGGDKYSFSTKPPEGGVFGTLTRVYTAPPSKPWVSLTNDEILDIFSKAPSTYSTDDDEIYIGERIEAALKEKNNG